MAIYHLHLRRGQRNSTAGALRSAGKKSDYVLRQGSYRAGSGELAYAASGHMPGWAEGDPGSYWRAADEHERVRASLFVELEFSLPRELSDAENRALAEGFAGRLCDGERLPWTLAMHRGGGSNPHVHLLISERANDGIERDAAFWFRRAAVRGRDPAAGGARKTAALQPKSWLLETRAAWSEACNAALADAGMDERIDHRTLKAQREDAEARGDHEAAMELERLPVHQSRASIALESSDPDGGAVAAAKPGKRRRRRRRRAPGTTPTGRKAARARRLNAEVRELRAGIARADDRLERLAAWEGRLAALKEKPRNVEAEYGRQELARREAMERARNNFGTLSARLAEQERRFRQVQAWRRGELERLSHCLFEARWRRSQEQLRRRLRLEGLAERLERQERELVHRRQAAVNKLGGRFERQHQEHLRFVEWHEKALPKLREAGRYRGPDDPSELHIVSHPVFVAPVSRKAGPEVGVIDRRAMDNEPPGRVSGWLRRLARVTEPFFTPPSERTERVLMRAVEERREAGLAVETGEKEVLVLVEEGWQARAVAEKVKVLPCGRWMMWRMTWSGSMAFPAWCARRTT